MKLLRRFVPVVLLGLGGALACGGGDSTGPQAGSVTGIFGDNDSVFTGGTLPVGFTVLSGSGTPLAGAHVTWTVTPVAAASITPATQSSDNLGNVATVVHVNSTLGPFTVTASVPGVSPIAFHLKVLDPCGYALSYTLGDTVAGSLSHTDCRVALGNAHYFYDYYKLTLPAGQNSIRINMSSADFDTYLDLYAFAGNQLGSNDDIQQTVIQNSQLDIILGQGGDYVIGANSYDPDTVGNYTLTAGLRAPTVSGCKELWMTPGATFTDSIKTTDCSDVQYNDKILFWMQATDVIRIAERAPVINPLLKLFNANFATQHFDSVAANDDSASGNPNAYITYTVPADGLFLLQIGTATPGDTGQYTLAFDVNTGPSARRAAPVDRRPRVLRVLPNGAFRGWMKRP